MKITQAHNAWRKLKNEGLTDEQIWTRLEAMDSVFRELIEPWSLKLTIQFGVIVGFATTIIIAVLGK